MPAGAARRFRPSCSTCSRATASNSACARAISSARPPSATIYAFLNLDDNELFIYQRLFELLSRDLPQPDVVVYLQAPADTLKRRLRDRARRTDGEETLPSEDYLVELAEAYNHFFFHYTATPLLVVETSHFDLSWGDDAVDDLLRQLKTMGRGTQYYVPRTS